MMGLAIHPQFLAGKPYFYLAYVYSFDSSGSNNEGSFFTTRISRFTCNVNTLTNPVTVTLQAGSEVYLKNDLPGSNDHNSGRLSINLSDNKLYYTIGDMGAGQFNNTNRPNNAQNVSILEGKVLRFNLEPDAAQTGDAAWIPDDNPFTAAGMPTPVYSYGHRNAQGLVWAQFASGTGKMYSSEHHDKTDDEINEIQAGKNYMWPKVSGFCDGNYNGLMLANMPVNETDDALSTPVKFCDRTTNKKEPLAVFSYRTKSQVEALSPNSAEWPSIAPSSIDFYKSEGAIPGWYPSLFITSLKTGAIYRIKLNANGTVPVDVKGQPDTVPYFRIGPSNAGTSINRRWRDICISPDGTTIFACTDSLPGLSNPGSILKFVYSGVILALPNNPVRPLQPIEKQVTIYPNPVVDFINITHAQASGKLFNYFITDMLNRNIVIGNYTGNKVQIATAILPKGFYIIKIYNKEKVCVAMKKLVKQ